MAVYKHGIYVSEQKTDLQALVQQDSGVIFAVGTAPVRNTMPGEAAAANEPVLCMNGAEAQKYLGYHNNRELYTLVEAMDVLFDQYRVAPVVFVNVFDPTVHKKHTAREEHLAALADSTARITLEGDVLPGSIKIETMQEIDDAEVWTDITSATTVVSADDFDTGMVETYETTIALPSGFSMGAKVYASYDVPDASKVTDTDVVGAINATTGRATGLELVGEVYARFGRTAGILIAPGWSHKPAVAAKMTALAASINGHFSAMAIADLDSTAIGGYSNAAAWKNQNGYVSPHLIACYPAVKYGNTIQHLSTHLAGEMALLAAQNDDIPYMSPSNRLTNTITGTCNLDGSTNYFGDDAANELNGQGIVTVTNFNGWRFWGNNTSAYPANTDPKDRWIPVRRMFDFVKTALVLNFRSQLDEPIVKRAIDAVVNSANTYLNGLTSRGAILGGRVEFLEDDNPSMAIADGKLMFRVYITPPSPARELNFVLQYDTEYLTNVFE